MSNQILHFPIKLRPTEPVQLDLFDIDKFLIGKYSFLNIKKCDESELSSYIDRFKFRLILDLRVFPSFDRPKFDHKNVLLKFKEKDILYFPIVYFKYTKNVHNQIYEHLSSLKEKSAQGPILFIYEPKHTTDEHLHGWKKALEKHISGSTEIHPNMIHRLERMQG